MYWLDVEVPAVDETPPLAPGAEQLIRRYRDRWRRDIWGPYRAKQGQQRTVVLDSTLYTCDGSEVFTTERLELVTNDGFFDQLMDLYMSCGLETVYDLFRHVNAGPGAGGIAYFTRDFINSSVAFLEQLIAAQLVQIQTEAATLAIQENTLQLKTVRDLQACFEKRHEHYHELFVGRLVRRRDPLPADAKDRLYELFRDCFHLQRRIANLQKSVDERNKKDGGDTATIRRKREKEPGRQAQVDAYLVPQRALIKELLAARIEIERIFPPALFVLDKLEADIDDHLKMSSYVSASSSAQRRSRDVELKYDSTIFWFLDELAVELLVAQVSLNNPGPQSRIFAYLGMDSRKRILEFGGLHVHVIEFCLTKRPGIKAFVKNGVLYGYLGVHFTEQERRDWALANRVLGRLGILLRLEEANTAGAFELRDVVLRQYRVDLEREIGALRAADARSQQRWAFVERLFAIAGLIVAAVLLPLGPGAVGVPAGLSLFLSLLEAGLLLVGVLLMVRSIVGLIDANLQAADDLKDKLIELGQADAAALSDLGELVTRNRALVKAGGRDLLIELVKLAAGLKIKVVARALDIQGYLDDVEFLQSNDGTAEEAPADG